MKHLKLFENFEQTYSSKFVADHIANNTPDIDNVPHHFIILIKRSKDKFVLKELNIQDIIDNDPDVKEYIDSGEERYDPDYDDIDPKQLYEPIVIFNNEVFDGYSRLSTLFAMGEEKIEAYINVGNK